MELKEIKLTREELNNLFTKWAIDFENNPKEFNNTLNYDTIEQYGEAQADTFLEYLNEIR